VTWAPSSMRRPAAIDRQGSAGDRRCGIESQMHCKRSNLFDCHKLLGLLGGEQHIALDLFFADPARCCLAGVCFATSRGNTVADPVVRDCNYRYFALGHSENPFGGPGDRCTRSDLKARTAAPGRIIPVPLHSGSSLALIARAIGQNGSGAVAQASVVSIWAVACRVRCTGHLSAIANSDARSASESSPCR